MAGLLSDAGLFVGVGEGGAFAPSDLSGLLWWHDGDLSNKTISGSNYTQWNDLSGNGRHWTRADTALAPNTGRTINGIVAMDFDGTESMTMGTGHGITSTAHIFGVVIFDTYANLDRYLEAGALSDGDAGFNVRMASAANQLALRLEDAVLGRDTLNSGAGNTFTPGSAHLLEIAFDGAGTYSITIDGTTTSATASNGGADVTGEDLNLFGGAAAQGASDGAVAALCAYSSIKSGADLTDLRSYFNTRFGL